MTIAINPSNNQDIDGILWGWAWGDGGPESLTFSFPTSTAEYTGYAAINGFSSFNAAQAEAVRDVLANIASFCTLTFTETTAADATLRYAEATSINYTNNSSVARLTGLQTVGTAMGGPPELAFGGTPPYIPTYAQGDNWFNTSLYDSPLFGWYSYQTIMHETGHSLGLKHGHITQAGHGIIFPALPTSHDSQEYSVMTYRQFPGDNPTNGYNNPDYPTTYMQDDIAALQYLYGANYGVTAHNGDTVYMWSPTTGEASIDGVGQGVPYRNFVFMTIWDGGGIDTYDFANYTTDLRVDLSPGAWTVLDTSVDHVQRANLGNDGAGGPEYFARGNIANALIDPNNPSETLSLIENAVGGSGHDTLLGNGIGNTLRGNDGNDQLYGLGGADTMDGGNGDDIYVVDDVGDVAAESSNGVGSGYDLVFSSVSYTLGFGIEDLVLEGLAANGIGNTENNYVTGNSGMNVLFGLDGDDILSGYEGNDTLLGGNGNDSLNGFTGDDVLDGGAGTDEAWYGNATAGVAVNLNLGIAQNTLGAGIDTLVLGTIENLTGSDFNDTLTGNSGNNVLAGGLGDDALDGGSGADTMYGVAGADFYVVDNVDDTAVESDELFGGNDTVASTVSFTLGLGIERLDLYGTGTINGTGNRLGNTIFGNDADNVLSGMDGFDYLYGGLGNDTLDGGTGGDWMEGNSGNDTYYVDSTFDVVTDGGGSGAGGGVDLVYTSVSYALNFGDDIEYLTLTGTAAINGTGNDLDNNILGNNGSNTIEGGIGNDTLDGGAGTDTVSYSSATSGVTVSLLLVGAQNTVGAGTDDLSNFENISGSYFDDTLTGNAGNNILIDWGGNDVLNGGAGADTVSYESSTSPVAVSLLLTSAQNTIGAGTDTLINFENLIGGSSDDSLTGSTGSNILIGGLGNDVLNGLAGTDTASYETANIGVTVSLVLAGAQDTMGAGIDTLENLENLTGSNFNDTLMGNSGNNLIEGLLGDDLLDGGAGTDTVSYESSAIGVVVNLGLTIAQNTVGAGIDTLSNFENLRGSNFNNTLTGDAKSNILIGGLGNDLLNGGGATDIVSYETATAGVTVSLLLAGAQNTVGAGTDTLSNFESLRGSNFNDTLAGNGGTNILTGGLGNDVLNGDAGSDTASYETSAAGVTVSLAVAGAQNTVGAGTDTLSNFENLRGSNFDDTLTGNAASNVIIGHLGDDLLDGGVGTDTASYETATSGVTVSLAIAGSQNTVGAGTDTLINFEHLRGGVANDALTGNAGSNIITGGLGHDTLDGGAGTDTASYDTAFGGVTVNLGVAGAQNTVNAGTDTLSNFENLKGSIHNDTLTGNAASNTIIGDQGNDVLNGDAGVDTASYETAKVGVTVSLAIAGAQNTIGAGTDTLSNFENLRGGNFNDTLTGNTGANSLFGGLGNDTMTGNSGVDSFVFNTALNATTNKDTITDFSPVDDTLVLENAIFTQFVATGAIPAGTFVANAGGVAGDANDFLLYDTNTGKLFYDADGNGAGAKVEFVTLLGIPALTAADFAII